MIMTRGPWRLDGRRTGTTKGGWHFVVLSVDPQLFIYADGASVCAAAGRSLTRGWVVGRCHGNPVVL